MYKLEVEMDISLGSCLDVCNQGLGNRKNYRINRVESVQRDSSTSGRSALRDLGEVKRKLSRLEQRAAE